MWYRKILMTAQNVVEKAALNLLMIQTNYKLELKQYTELWCQQIDYDLLFINNYVIMLLYDNILLQ